MNFIDYCIATKNYSALDAVNEYTKIFANKEDKPKPGTGKKVNKKNTVEGVTYDKDGNMIVPGWNNGINYHYGKGGVDLGNLGPKTQVKLNKYVKAKKC